MFNDFSDGMKVLNMIIISVSLFFICDTSLAALKFFTESLAVILHRWAKGPSAQGAGPRTWYLSYARQTCQPLSFATPNVSDPFWSNYVSGSSFKSSVAVPK